MYCFMGFLPRGKLVDLLTLHVPLKKKKKKKKEKCRWGEEP